MKTLLPALALGGLFGLVACEQCEVVDKQDSNTKIVNLKTCNCEVISKDELKALRGRRLGKHVTRYQMRTEGYRTWRFDTATGINLLAACTRTGTGRNQTLI
jgi:hypothetical protein